MPAEPKLTPWFDWPVKPVHVGLYEVRTRGFSWVHIGRCYWNGRTFSTDLGFIVVMDNGDQWRGLAEKPKEQGNAG